MTARYRQRELFNATRAHAAAARVAAAGTVKQSTSARALTSEPPAASGAMCKQMPPEGVDPARARAANAHDAEHMGPSFIPY